MAFKGALAYKSADLNALNATTATAMVFNTDSYDTDGFHDTASNTSRMTVPSGVTSVKLNALIALSNFDFNVVMTLEIRKNGSALTPEIKLSGNAFTSAPTLQVVTPRLSVTAGDYFEVFLTVASDTSLTVLAESWFAMWEVPATLLTFSGAVAKKAADQTAANYTSVTALAFDAETLDVGAWHDTATDNNRLTVPSGVAYAQFSLQVGLTNFSAGEMVTMAIRKTVAAMTPAVKGYFMTASSSNTPKMQIQTAPLPVSAADYFDATLQVTVDTSISVIALETTLSGWAVG